MMCNGENDIWPFGFSDQFSYDIGLYKCFPISVKSSPDRCVQKSKHVAIVKAYWQSADAIDDPYYLDDDADDLMFLMIILVVMMMLLGDMIQMILMLLPLVMILILMILMVERKIPIEENDKVMTDVFDCVADEDIENKTWECFQQISDYEIQTNEIFNLDDEINTLVNGVMKRVLSNVHQ